MEYTNNEEDMTTNTNKYMELLTQATRDLDTITPKERDETFSDKTKSPLEQRKMHY